jgi:hypothetical protein
MDTLNPTVIGHTFMSNVVGNTAETAVKRARPRQQHVLYVEAVTLQTTKLQLLSKTISS